MVSAGVIGVRYECKMGVQDLEVMLIGVHDVIQ